MSAKASPAISQSWRDVVDHTVVSSTEANAIKAAVKAVADYENASKAAEAEDAVKAVADYEASEKKKMEELREIKIRHYIEMITCLRAYSERQDEKTRKGFIERINNLEKDLDAFLNMET